MKSKIHEAHPHVIPDYRSIHLVMGLSDSKGLVILIPWPILILSEGIDLFSKRNNFQEESIPGFMG